MSRTIASRTGLGLAILLGMAAAACSSDDTSAPPDASVDTSVPDTSVPDTSVPDTSVPDAADGGSDAADAADTNIGDGHIDPTVCQNEVVDAGEAGVKCNSLVNDAPAVIPTCGPAPVATGGTVVPGTYILTAQTSFTDACLEAGAGDDSGLAGGSVAAKLVIAGQCTQAIETFSGTTTATLSYAFTTNGNNFTITTSCPGAGGVVGTATYTATPTTLTIISQQLHNTQVYTKQ